MFALVGLNHQAIGGHVLRVLDMPLSKILLDSKVLKTIFHYLLYMT